MKFGQWGDRSTKEDGSFSFVPVNVVNSSAHTAPSAFIKGKGRSCRAMDGLDWEGRVGHGALQEKMAEGSGPGVNCYRVIHTCNCN